MPQLRPTASGSTSVVQLVRRSVGSFNAVSNLAIIGALLWWRSPQIVAHRLPAERLFGAIMTGFRHARHNPHVGATLIRAFGFFLFAGTYWALLPLVARNQIAAGPQLYGVLLGGIGAEAVVLFCPAL